MGIRTAAAVGAASLLMASAANAALISDGTLDGGALVTDTATGLQWLSPVATSAQSYNSVIGGFDGLTTTDGFRVATEAQVLNMFSSNFDPTNAVQYNTFSSNAVAPINAFFNVFGVTEHVTCTPGGGVSTPCPRTQGYTSTGGTGAGTVIDIGYIIFSGGEGISQSSSTSQSGDPQFGTFLVREASPVPLPAAAWLLLSGLGGLGAAVRRSRDV